MIEEGVRKMSWLSNEDREDLVSRLYALYNYSNILIEIENVDKNIFELRVSQGNTTSSNKLNGHKLKSMARDLFKNRVEDRVLRIEYQPSKIVVAL